MKKILLLSVAAWSLWSCNKEATDIASAPMSVMSVTIKSCGVVTTQNLMAGQKHVAGTVTVSNDATNMYVTYTTTDGWKMLSTELYVGDCDKMPTNKAGNPQVGHFPYKVTHSTSGITSYTYSFPLSSIPESMCIAAHANVVKVNEAGKVVQSETAWGEGSKFVDKGNWAMYFSYTKQVCEPEPEPTEKCYGSTETAWTSGTKYNVTGGGNWATFSTYTGSTTVVNIYAGQHHVAGTATINPSTISGKVEVVINLNDNWELQNVSESVKIQGYTDAPSGNPAPGKFTTYKGTSTSLTLDAFSYYGIHLDVVAVVECAK